LLTKLAPRLSSSFSYTLLYVRSLDKRAEIRTHEQNKTTSKGPIAFLDLLLSVKLPDGSQLNDADVQVRELASKPVAYIINITTA